MLVFGVVGYAVQEAGLSARAAGAGAGARRHGRELVPPVDAAVAAAACRSSGRTGWSARSLASALVLLLWPAGVMGDAPCCAAQGRCRRAVRGRWCNGATQVTVDRTRERTRVQQWEMKHAACMSTRRRQGGRRRWRGRRVGLRRRSGGRLGADQAGDVRHPGRHRRRRRPDGALHPGRRHEAQSDEAAADRHQQGWRRRRRRLPRRQGSAKAIRTSSSSRCRTCSRRRSRPACRSTGRT